MRKWIYAVLILGLVGGGIGLYQYNKPHKKILDIDPDFSMSAVDIFEEYELDEYASNEKYLDKVIHIQGTVQDVKEEGGSISITLDSGGMFGVICQLDELSKHKRTDFTIGEEVSLKGICTGLLMDVVLVRCIEVTQ